MSYFQTPQLNWAEPKDVLSGPTSMFLASMEAGARAKLAQREAESRATQLQQQQYEFERQMDERAADNARDERRINLEDERGRNALQQQKDLAEAKAKQEREEKARAAVPDVYRAAQENPEYAAVLARAHGVTLTPEVAAPGANDTGGAPSDAAAPAPRFINPLDPFGLRAFGGSPAGPPRASGGTAAASLPLPLQTILGPRRPSVPTATPAPEQDDPDRLPPEGAPELTAEAPARPTSSAPPASGRFQIAAPGMEPITGSPSAAFEAGRALSARQRQENARESVAALEELAKTATSPLAKQTLAELHGEALTGAFAPADVVKRFWTVYEAREQRASTEKNARVAAGRVGNREERRGNLTSLTGLRQDLRQFDNQAGLRLTGKEYGDLERATRLLSKSNGPSQAAGFDMFLKGVRGGAVTKNTLEYIGSHMSGGMGQLETALAKARNGQYGDSDVQAMREAVAEATGAVRDDVGRYEQAFRETYFSPEYEAFRGNLVNSYNQRFVPFGFKPMGHDAGESSITATGRTKTPARGNDDASWLERAAKKLPGAKK